MNEISDQEEDRFWELAIALAHQCIIYCPPVSGSSVFNCTIIGLSAAFSMASGTDPHIYTSEEDDILGGFKEQFYNQMVGYAKENGAIRDPIDWNAAQSHAFDALNAFMPGEPVFASLVDLGSAEGLLKEAYERNDKVKPPPEAVKKCCLFILERFLASLNADAASYHSLHSSVFLKADDSYERPEGMGDGAWHDGLLTLQLMRFCEAEWFDWGEGELFEFMEDADEYEHLLSMHVPEPLMHDLKRHYAALAKVTSDRSRFSGIFETAKDMTRMMRNMALEDPLRHNEDLATFLYCISPIYEKFGMNAEAVEAAEESVSLRSGLNEKYPDKNPDTLARSLYKSGTLLIEKDDIENGMARLKRAADIWRSQSSGASTMTLDEFGRCLTALAAATFEHEESSDALKLAEQAVDIYRKLSIESSGSYDWYLAENLTLCAAILNVLDRTETALPIVLEALEIYRNYGSKYSLEYQHSLSECHANAAEAYLCAGEMKLALHHTDEAISIRKALIGFEPELMAPKLARSHGLRGIVFLNFGKIPEAQSSLAYCLKVFTAPVTADPEAFGEDAHAYVNVYKEVCEEGRFKPDTKLLAPYDRIFKQMGLNGGA